MSKRDNFVNINFVNFFVFVICCLYILYAELDNDCSQKYFYFQNLFLENMKTKDILLPSGPGWASPWPPWGPQSGL